MGQLKQLHLARVHRSLGAKMMPFAGWEMPVQYTSIAEEHLATRNSAGLFDVSHMGEFSVNGKRALDFLQHVTTNDVSRLGVGDAQYSSILNERGGTKDDILVYRLDEQKFMVVCNAANVEKIDDWLTRHAGDGVELENITATTILLALQGPKAREMLQGLTTFDLSQLKRYGKNAFVEIADVPVLVSRTGYTGEDGFEFFIFDEPPSNPQRGKRLWDTLLRAGDEAGVKPCGLGARDTTRLEAGLCLYGHELTEEITPLEAGIDFVVKLGKGEFVGREALLKQKEKGPQRVRIGLRMLEAGIPREGCKLLKDGQKVGVVTSGTFSPLLKVGIAMGYTSLRLVPGAKISVEIRGKIRAAEVTGFPFYNPGMYGRSRR